MSNSLANLLFNFFKTRIDKAYYQGRESLLGHHKRDIVVIQVDQTCNSLKATKVQFEDALSEFKALVNIQESSLDKRYQLLSKQLEYCQARSDDVSSRIGLIEEVSQSLFKEWEEELNQYSNRSLRAQSRQQLKTSRKQYGQLLRTLRKAENQIAPVLSAFKDQVLFLKHNLNAQAIAALQSEFIEIGVDISQLIEVMELTISEASQFVSTLNNTKALPSA